MTYLWSDKQAVEFREDAEHLLRIPSGREPVSESRNDLIFDSCNSVVVRCLGSIPNLRSLRTDVQDVDVFDTFVRQSDLFVHINLYQTFPTKRGEASS